MTSHNFSEPDLRVRVFFYGSFINRDVLSQVGLIPERVEAAWVWGYDIRIEPHANLVHSDQHCVYGIVCDTTHVKLRQLYGQKWVSDYLPEAVLVETNGGRFSPALCYISPSSKKAPAADEYIDRIVISAREYGFPEWYIARLDSFRSR